MCEAIAESDHGRDASGLGASLLFARRDEFGSFDAYVWRFTGGGTKRNTFRSLRDLPASTPESDAMSKDLKKRGFRSSAPPSATPSCRPSAW